MKGEIDFYNFKQSRTFIHLIQENKSKNIFIRFRYAKKKVY